jgi:hypothetical protein
MLLKEKTPCERFIGEPHTVKMKKEEMFYNSAPFFILGKFF